MVIRKGVFLCFLSVGARCFFFLLLDGLGDHFGVLFGTKMWLKQYVFVCFCLGGPSGVSLVSFICFGLAWVAIWGPHGVLLGVLLLFLWSLLGPVGSLWEPLGTHVLLWGSFWGSCGILGSLFGSLGGPVGSILGHSVVSFWEVPRNPLGLPGLGSPWTIDDGSCLLVGGRW